MNKNSEPDDTMLEIVDDIKFYVDYYNKSNVYVEFKTIAGGGHLSKVDSINFLSILGNEYRARTGLMANPDFKPLLSIKCQDVIATQSPTVKLTHRLSGSLSSNIICYSLENRNQERVIIGPGKWKCGPNLQLRVNKIISDEVSKKQTKPAQGGGDYLKLLRPYINLNEDDFLLLAIWIVQLFSRQCSHFALIISSDKGTGKTTLTKLIQELVDPSKIEATVMTKRLEDLKVHLARTYLACFDNTEYLQVDVSNLLCAAITGSTAVKRKLYRDSDMVVLDLHNVIVLNGIDIIPQKSDLVDRSLRFELQPISKSARKTDDEFWNNFEEDRSAILGAIFDVLAKAMGIVSNLQINESPRMADAYKEMLAIALALDISQEDFSRIFNSNIDRLQEEYIHSNRFIEFILEYMSRRPSGINAPATAVYNEMKSSIVGDASFFPPSPSSLSRKLNNVKSTLSNAGYGFGSEKKANANYISIKRIEEKQAETQKVAKTHKVDLLADDESDDESEGAPVNEPEVESKSESETGPDSDTTNEA